MEKASTCDVDDEMTTDVGQTSSSEAESSSGLSGNEGKRVFVRRCRFGQTVLETIPATPSAGVSASIASPPGLSFAAMREARDVCKPEPMPAKALDTKENVTTVLLAGRILESGVEGTISFSDNLCRLNENKFGTVPKTPTNVSRWKAVATAVGSPPGLSRAEMRRTRDACKGAGVTQAAWGSSHDTESSAKDSWTLASGSAKRHTARETLTRMKQEAALLKDSKSASHIGEINESPVNTSGATTITPEWVAERCEGKMPNSADSDDGMDAGQSSSSEGESSCEMGASSGQRCRFGITPLGTIPSTPVGGCASPPGLSRKAMRQARDMCKAGGTATASSWGTSEALTITPLGKPMTPPPGMRSAQRRASRELACDAQVSEDESVASKWVCVGWASQLPR